MSLITNEDLMID